jgi:hypothetical protein
MGFSSLISFNQAFLQFLNLDTKEIYLRILNHPLQKLNGSVLITVKTDTFAEIQFFNHETHYKRPQNRRGLAADQ